MNKVTFNCETITPMFLAGADGKTPELRPPSIKAAMRFWWRALNGHLSLSDLKKQESEIFGGSGDNEGRSKFSIRVKHNPLQTKSTIKDKIWDNRQNQVQSKHEGMGYLLYSTFMQAQNQKPYIDKTEFSVIITSSNKNIIKEVSKIFLIFSLLGSIGTRSRRGAGCFYIKNILGNDQNLLNEIALPLIINDKNNLKLIIENLLSGVKSKGVSNSTYSNFTSARIFIFDNQTNVDDCFEIFGKCYKSFRSYSKPDYDTVKDYLSGSRITNTIEKAAMGLPISYRYRSLNGKSALIEGSASKERQRSSSPIYFKVLAAKNNGDNIIYFPIVIVFERNLLAATDKIRVKDTDRRGVAPILVLQPSNTIISQFISSIPKNVEVTL